MNLASAKAVVTGGASGLGLATARRVIEAGGSATLLDMNEEQGAASAADLGERAEFFKVDVSQEAQVQEAIGKSTEDEEAAPPVPLHTELKGIHGYPELLSNDPRGYSLPLAEILPAFTSNVAQLLRLRRKGSITPGCDADLVVL